MADGDNNNNQIQVNARALRDYTVPTVSGFPIRRPAVQANNFEIKPGLIQIVEAHQFGGYPIETPDDHLAKFLQYCNTIKMNGVTNDAICLQLFPFSLKDKALTWFNSLL